VLELLTHAGLSDDHAAEFVARYPGAEPGFLLQQARTDAFFRAENLAIAEARAEQGPPTWFYQFQWRSGGSTFGKSSHHCLDIPFVFDLLDAEQVALVAGDSPPQGLADAIHGAYATFIRNLDPGSAWPSYELKRRSTMLWDSVPTVAADPLREVREAWL
jgi:para-nitrobenzyl esterase